MAIQNLKILFVVYRVTIFLLLNFAALAIGGLSTNSAVKEQWYLQLNKAPWTPPGWVFGAAWTTIMICFSFYMAYLWKNSENSKLLWTLYISQWILNVLWNPIFFNLHMTGLGLVVISSLLLLVLFIGAHYFKQASYYSLLIAPYLIWMIIATSLNAYVVLKN